MAEPHPHSRSLTVHRCEGTGLSALRQWLRTNLPSHFDLGAAAELVCTELATNAIEHGDGSRQVRINIHEV